MSTTTITDDQLAQAYIFLSSLKANNKLSSDWSDHLKKANDPSYGVKDKIDYLDNFLADSGYDTTAEAVLSIIKVNKDGSNNDQVKWWNDYQASLKPNKQSDRFVQDILQDSTLYKGWSKAILDSANQNNLSAANNFLQDKGYDCSADQVNASFNKMRNHEMNYWTNLYGNVILSQVGKSAVPGPAIVIDGLDNKVSIGNQYLMNTKFENGKLSWDIGSGLEENFCSGSITFSQIDTPSKSDSYVGDIFSGTITYKDGSSSDFQGTYDIYGKVGPIPNNVSGGGKGNIYVPPAVQNNKPLIEKISTFLGPYIQIGFAITLVAGLVGFLGKKGKEIKDKLSDKAKESADKADKQAEKNDALNDKESEVLKTDSRIQQEKIETMKQEMESSVDPAKREAMQEEINKADEAREETEKEEEAKEEESSKEDEKTASEDGEALGEAFEI